MRERELHAIAERLRSKIPCAAEHPPDALWNLIDELDIKVIGSKRHGRYRLPKGRLAESRIPQREIVIQAALLNSADREAELKEVLAHELAHFVLHEGLTLQRPLPFGNIDAGQLDLGRLNFSQVQRDTLEREAIDLGALLQVPADQLRKLLRPLIRVYMTSSWTRTSSGVAASESAAAKRYSENAVALVIRMFNVTVNTAKFALGYWSCYARPSREWQRETRHHYSVRANRAEATGYFL